jgi:hypothetical protein
MGQYGADMTSMVVFDTATDDSAKITPLPVTNPLQPNLLFDLAGDSITSLVYLNGVPGVSKWVVAPTNPSSYLTGALVSFEAGTGEVVAVIGYQGSTPRARQEGGRVVLEGTFVGVWTPKDKEMTRGRTESLTLDAKTGRVLN